VISTRRLIPYLYLAPMLALLLIVFGYPLVSIFNFSLRRIRGATGPFIGLENYRQVFKDEVFWQAVTHNALLLLSVPVLIVVSILVAVVLYERVAGWKAYRSLLFVPYVTAVPIAGVVFGNMFQLNGAVNEVLRAVGRILRESTRPSDLTARYGGEEFVVVLPGCDVAQAHKTGDSLRQRIATEDWSRIAGGLQITTSIGVATLADVGDPGDLLDAADRALYAAKHAGKDRVH
jgi:hypothetical protein